MHGGRVVNAVTHEAHSMTVTAQDTDDPDLLLGAELGKDACLLHRSRKLTVIHLVDIHAEQQPVDFQTDLPADASCHRVVIARQDFHGYAVFAQRLYSRV
ncbi:hypothetical protein SDC9_47630 [bioreactor metagenome]|uniref:Uncharacterized protein n=1 Tax=bioreactor metagenome TaxID=1076179 RepID=A0A644WC65_9ZZZZ